MTSVDPQPVAPRGAAAGDNPRRHHLALAALHVIVAPQRAERPVDADLATGGKSPADWCPFCIGNEARTPPDILRAPADTALPWRSRIVANRYPFVVEDGQAATGAPGLRGVHEVLIESAAHERSILAVDAAAWREVWELGHRRLGDFARRGDLAWATIFKNSGPRAGASLEHLHSQLVAIDFVPPLLAAELAAAGKGDDPFAALLGAARADGRIVAETAGVVALVPPAARQPFETWIMPCIPEPFFHTAARERVAAVADLTRWFVERLERLAPGTDYNWWLHQPPHLPADAAFRWHLEIVPRMAPLAGFELGTGCFVHALPAEESARRLREA